MKAKKAELRRLAQARRDALPDRETRGRLLIQRAFTLPEHHQAKWVMFYVSARSEAPTPSGIASALAKGKQAVVPWCWQGRLELFHLHSMDELAPGRYNILEPRPELRHRSAKRVSPDQLDLIFVPGVAFDCRGGRLGHGAGYYDKLLADVRPDAWRVGLAFECQRVDRIPLEPHDVLMDILVTELAIYRPYESSSC